MKENRLSAAALATALGLLVQSGVAASLDDVQLWAGSGNNRAALVIDWNDGKGQDSLVWGYRWDGKATGMDMLQAVAAADSRLYAHLSDFSWGRAVLGIGYDLNNSGSFAVNPSLSFDQFGIRLDSGSADAKDSRVAADSADHYLEGWNNGFWAYYVKADGTAAWASATTGAADRTLANGAWDGYSFAPAFSSAAPHDPVVASVPEPEVVHLLALGILAVGFMSRRHEK